MENWKPVRKYSFEDIYEVSNTGKVRNRKTGLILCPNFDDEGYARIVLFDGKRARRRFTTNVHRIVAETYLENPKNLPIVNHKDGDKSNNSVSNLEWISYRENNLHRHRVINSRDKLVYKIRLIDSKISILQKRKEELLGQLLPGQDGEKRKYKHFSEIIQL